VNHYIHHAPGRTRVRIPGLKSNVAAGLALKRELLEVAGISDVELSIRTGSVLVHYDRRLETARTIMDVLQCQPAWGVQEVGGSTLRMGRKVAKIVAARVFEAVLERAVVAAVAALL
jgi:copper chaperone CopZ